MSLPQTDAERSTLIFLHLPKTAGTTLNRIIEQHYHPLRTYTIISRHPHWSIRHLERLPESRKRSIRLVRGHMPFGVHKLLPQTSTYMTVMRDPVDRLISTYYFARRTKGHPLHRHLIERNLDLEGYVRMSPVKDNVQCKMLAGVEMDLILPGKILPELCERGNPVNGIDLEKICTRETFDQALGNLRKHFLLVGLSERFEQTLALAHIMLGWQVRPFSNANVTKSRKSLAEEKESVLDLVRSYNAYDIELYRAAERMFDEALATHADRMEETLLAIRNARKGSSKQGYVPDVAAMFRVLLSRVNSYI